MKTKNMSDKEFKCGYYAGKLDYLDLQTYHALKQKSKAILLNILGLTGEIQSAPKLLLTDSML